MWRRIYCDHIRLELFHIKNEETGRMAADDAIKKSLAELKYKWKNMINDGSGKRSQIMELRKPTGDAAADLPPFENPRNLQLGQEPVTIKSGVIMECSTIRQEQKGI